MYNILPDIAKACITSSHLSTGALYLLLNILIGPITAENIAKQYDPNFFNMVNNMTDEEQYLLERRALDELLQALFNHSDMSEEAKLLIIEQLRIGQMGNNDELLFYINKYTPHITLKEKEEEEHDPTPAA